jgi:NADPH-dependent 2,4-dienoyl-CoA reductase/sulfur reductase-like enzyme
MTAGAAQVLLKDAAAVPDGPVVLAGTGPLLLLIAVQYLRAGANVAALVDLAPPGAAPRRGLPHLLPAALNAPAYLRKGLALMVAIRRAGIRRLNRVTGLRALGTERLEAVEIRRGVASATERIPATALLVHAGIVPNTTLTRMLRLPHRWDDAQRCWAPETDAWGSTALDAFAIAGDGLRILGAEAALHAGRLAALETAHRLGRLTRAERNRRAAPEQQALARHAAARPLLDALFAPPDWLGLADADTTICRCEEVTLSDIRAAIAEGCRDPNQVKAVTRCAMGACQGRQCGQPLARIVAEATGQSESAVPPPRARPPLRRLTIGELAELETTETTP